MKPQRALIKKKIIPNPEQLTLIKKRISQGFNSERIADMVDLPASVIKRYFNSIYFKVKNRETCAVCGKRFKKSKKQNQQNQQTKVFCSVCKKKASGYDEIGFYSAIETCPSDMEDIKISNVKDFQLKKEN